MIEHPDISRYNTLGYLEDEEKPTRDYLNNEVYIGDKVAIDEDGDFVHKDDLEYFLQKKHGFTFKEYEGEE